MSNLIEIPKANKIEEYPYADNFPCWLPVQDKDENIVRPMIICNCGVYTGVNAHHIHKDGRITASYYHPKEVNGYPNGCGWHVFLKMKDWIGLEFLPHKDYPEK